MMTTLFLSREIADFFLDYDMLEGATYKELFEATYRALEEKDKKGIKIILEYFYKVKDANFRAQMIFKEVLSRWL